MKKNVKLPKKASALIRLALKDLRKAESTPKVVIDMGNWCKKEGDTCSVCFAGSVMRNTCQYGGSPEESYMATALDQFPRETQKKFLALDAFRAGSIWEGLEQLDLIDSSKDLIGVRPQVSIPDYPTDEDFSGLGLGGYIGKVEEFHTAMEKMADKLESKGF